MTDDLTIITIHKTGSGDPDLLHFPQVDELRDAFDIKKLKKSQKKR